MSQSSVLKSNKRARVGPTSGAKSPLRNTPRDVVHHIMTLLPLRDSIRNGLVSTEFRDTWRHCRRLIFDRLFLHSLGLGDDVIPTIDAVFDSHRGRKITELSLVLCHLLAVDPTPVRSWVHRAAAKGLEDLSLEVLPGNYFPISGDLLDIETLKTLELERCEIEAPIALTSGLRSLASLVLRRVVFNSDVFEKVLGHCAALGSLEISVCSGFEDLRIRGGRDSGGARVGLTTLKIDASPDLDRFHVDAPLLKSFSYEGKCKMLGFEKLQWPKLREAFMGFTTTKAYTHCYKMMESFVISSLPTASVLTVSNLFLEYISPRIQNSVYIGLPCTFPNLKKFHLFMVGPSFCNLFDILSFISLCPALTSLVIDVNEFKFELGSYYEAHLKGLIEIFQCHFEKLEIIKLLGFKFDSHEVDIMRYLVRKSPNLKTLTLESPKNGKSPFRSTDLRLCRGFFDAWKCSPNATIRVFDHRDS